MIFNFHCKSYNLCIVLPLCKSLGFAANDDDDDVFVSMEDGRYTSQGERQTKALSALKENRINTNKASGLFDIDTFSDLR